MGTRTSLVGEMSVLLMVLSAFIFAESGGGKPLGTAGNAVTRTAGNAVTRRVGPFGVPVMH